MSHINDMCEPHVAGKLYYGYACSVALNYFV